MSKASWIISFFESAQLPENSLGHRPERRVPSMDDSVPWANRNSPSIMSRTCLPMSRLTPGAISQSRAPGVHPVGEEGEHLAPQGRLDPQRHALGELEPVRRHEHGGPRVRVLLEPPVLAEVRLRDDAQLVGLDHDVRARHPLRARLPRVLVLEVGRRVAERVRVLDHVVEVVLIHEARQVAPLDELERRVGADPEPLHRLRLEPRGDVLGAAEADLLGVRAQAVEDAQLVVELDRLHDPALEHGADVAAAVQELVRDEVARDAAVHQRELAAAGEAILGGKNAVVLAPIAPTTRLSIPLTTRQTRSK